MTPDPRCMLALLSGGVVLAACAGRLDFSKVSPSADAGSADSGTEAGPRISADASGPVVETLCSWLAQCCPTLPVSSQAWCAEQVGFVDDCLKALTQSQQGGQCTAVPPSPLAASCQRLDLCCLSVSSSEVAACGGVVVSNDDSMCSAYFASMSVCAGYAAPSANACLTLGGCCSAPWLSAQDAAACSALVFAGDEKACAPAVQTYCVLR